MREGERTSLWTSAKIKPVAVRATKPTVYREKHIMFCVISAVDKERQYFGRSFDEFRYTLCPKSNPLMFDNNFGKCGPIFKILSPTDSWENYVYT